MHIIGFSLYMCCRFYIKRMQSYSQSFHTIPFIHSMPCNRNPLPFTSKDAFNRGILESWRSFLFPFVISQNAIIAYGFFHLSTGVLLPEFAHNCNNISISSTPDWAVAFICFHPKGLRRSIQLHICCLYSPHTPFLPPFYANSLLPFAWFLYLC